MNTKLFGSLLALAVSFSVVRAADALDEKGFQTHMKSVGKLGKGLKTNIEAKNAAAVEKDATTVAADYKAMAGFWKARKAAHATEWSEASAKAATATAVAAKAGDWDKVKTEWGIVGNNCKKCHEAHREKLDDGGYKIKN